MKKIKGILFFILGITLPLSAMKPKDKKITDVPTELLWTLADSDNPAKALKWLNNVAKNSNKELHDKISPIILTYLCKKISGKSDNHSIMHVASKHGMFNVIEHVKKQTHGHIDNTRGIDYVRAIISSMQFEDVLKIMHLLRATSKDMKNRHDNYFEDKFVKELIHKGSGAKLLVTIGIDGFPKILELVLKHSNIDINHVSFDFNDQNYNIFPLSEAIKNKKLECVKLLLNQNNIDVNLQDDKVRTPLINAIYHYNLDAIRELLKHNKINVNKTDYYGRTPLLIALEKKYFNIITLLMSHPNIDINLGREEYGTTPLHYVVAKLANRKFFNSKREYKKFFEILQLFLEHKKIDVNKRNSKGETALLYSIITKNKIITQLLLQDARTDVNLARLDGLTPLRATIQYNNIPALNMLLKHPNIRPNVPELFHLAKDNDEICEILKAWTKRKK